jgi:hypothetical protein
MIKSKVSKEAVVVTNRRYRAAVASVLGLIGLLGLGAIGDSNGMGNKIAAGVIGLTFVLGALRASISATLVVGNSEVVARTLTWTYRWPVSHVSRFTVAEGGVGFYHRKFLVLNSYDATRPFKELNWSTSPADGMDPTSELNQRLHASLGSEG